MRSEVHTRDQTNNGVSLKEINMILENVKICIFHKLTNERP